MGLKFIRCQRERARPGNVDLLVPVHMIRRIEVVSGDPAPRLMVYYATGLYENGTEYVETAYTSRDASSLIAEWDATGVLT